MYRNLEAEIVRANLNKEDIANKIGKTYNTLLLKISEKYPFALKEALIIHEEFFPQLEFLYLFQSDIGNKKVADGH